MSWRSLGSKEPDWLNWRTYDQPALGDLFRVRHSFSGESPGTGPVQCTAFYSNGGRYGWEEFWPDTDNRLFIMRPPLELLQAGLTIRFLAIRLSSRAKKFTGANWQVTLEEYNGPTTPVNDPRLDPLLRLLY